MVPGALSLPGALARVPAARARGARGARSARARVVPARAAAAPPDAPSRAWHCPPPAGERPATQAASTLSKLPPHVLDQGGLDPATQSAQNQQAYLGSLAERFLPVDLSTAGMRVLNVDPPVFAVPDFVAAAEADALAALAADSAASSSLAGAATSAPLYPLLPAPMGDGMPALAQRLAELVDRCKAIVRCDGAWLDEEGSALTNWGPDGGFATVPPENAFAFEMPRLCAVPSGETSATLPDAFHREGANEAKYQRRALVRVFLTDPPPPPPEPEKSDDDDDDGSSSSAPDIDRDAFGLKLTICDVALAPRKGSAVVTFPSFADGMPDERVECVVRATEAGPCAWLDFPISVGLGEAGIAKPVTMADVTVEKVGEEATVGESAREMNRQAWRANVSAGGGDEDGGEEGATEEAKKKLEEMKDAGL